MRSIHISGKEEMTHLFGKLNYCKLNINPDGNKTGDCYIRATAILANISWDQAFIELAAIAFNEKKSMNDPYVIFLMLRKYNFRQISNNKYETLEDLANDLVLGRYLVFVPSHVYPIIHYICYDNISRMETVKYHIDKIKSEKILSILYRIC